MEARTILAADSHRPWPMPDRPWLGFMRWTNLAFLHWRVDAEEIASRLPPGLELDTFEGEAWLGLVPFRMESVHVRWLPPVPTAGWFPELNLRTYVIAEGKPGVFFFSLDAASRLAVAGARTALNLPYMNARMEITRSGDSIEYRSIRSHRGAPAARFEGVYRPSGPPFSPKPGTRYHWFTERYALYGQWRCGGLYAIDIHHEPWTLHPADADLAINTMFAGSKLPVPQSAPVAHVADPRAVLAWAPRPVA